MQFPLLLSQQQKNASRRDPALSSSPITKAGKGGVGETGGVMKKRNPPTGKDECVFSLGGGLNQKRKRGCMSTLVVCRAFFVELTRLSGIAKSWSFSGLEGEGWIGRALTGPFELPSFLIWRSSTRAPLICWAWDVAGGGPEERACVWSHIDTHAISTRPFPNHRLWPVQRG